MPDEGSENLAVFNLDDEADKKKLLGSQTAAESGKRSSNRRASTSDDDPDSTEDSTSEKEKGNKCFSEGRYQDAVDHWSSALRTLNYILSKDIEDKEKLEEFRNMKKTLHLNLAIGYLRVGRGMDCVKQCDEVLELEPRNAKALYRKAQGWSRLSEHGNAAASLQKLIEVDPKNVAASQFLRETKVEMRRHAVKEKRMHRALFEQLEHDERSVKETAGWCRTLFDRIRHFRHMCSQSLSLMSSLVYLFCHSCKRRAWSLTGVTKPKTDMR